MGQMKCRLKMEVTAKGSDGKLGCYCWTKLHLNVLNRIRYYLIVE